MLRTLLTILILVGPHSAFACPSINTNHGLHSKLTLKLKKDKSNWIHMSRFVSASIDAGLHGEGIYGGEDVGEYYESELKVTPDGTLVIEFVEMRDIKKSLVQENFVCRTAVSFEVKNEGEYILEYEACKIQIIDKQREKVSFSKILNQFQNSRYFEKLP